MAELDERLMIELEDFCGFPLKREQAVALAEILKGKDVIASLPVGYGKSLIYQLLPMLFKKENKPSKVLVVAPLSAIMREQVEKLSKIKIIAVHLTQMCNVANQEEKNVIDAVLDADIIYGHPESFLVADKGCDVLRALQGKIGALVIDECHKINDWGKDFRKSFSDLGNLRSFFPNLPVICLSGTLTKENTDIMIKKLTMVSYSMISVSPDKQNLKLIRLRKPKGSLVTSNESIYKKEIDSLKVLEDKYPVTLMFMPMQYMADAMHYAHSIFGGGSKVDVNNARFGCLFSNQDEHVMSIIQQDLQTLTPRFRLVFATSVIGMGFDPPAVDHVIHLKPPMSMTNYLQEIGRAGRRGQQAKATLHFCPADISNSRAGMKNDITKNCQEETCLRQCLLSCFGFKTTPGVTGCACCNLCVCECDECKMVQVVADLKL